MNNDTPNDRLDEATAQRLAKMRSLPVDTSRLDKSIQSSVPRPAGRLRLWQIRPLRAVAASAAILLMVGAILWSLSGGEVLASPETMARFHQDLLSGKVAAVQVDSIAEANRTLAAQWNATIEIPQVPAEHGMMCCMRTIKDKRVACVLLKNEGVPVTMAVARAMDMKLPGAQTITRNGMEYRLQSAGELNMVMTERAGRWICLIGKLPAERLMNIASAISFD